MICKIYFLTGQGETVRQLSGESGQSRWAWLVIKYLLTEIQETLRHFLSPTIEITRQRQYQTMRKNPAIFAKFI